MQRVPTYRPSLEEALGGKPTEAEEKVLAAAKAGEIAWLRPDCSRPEKPSSATRIRADLIRFLMLGGDEEHPVHSKGVMIQSAFIEGKLDLEGCETQLDLYLAACRFDTQPDFDDAHLGGLYLPGCYIPGLTARRMQLQANLNLCALELKDGEQLPFTATATVEISNARIAGQLACDGGRFYAFEGKSLNGNGITVGASVILGNRFHATGQVNFIRAKVTGNLQVSTACIEDVFDLRLARLEEGLFLTNASGVQCDGPWAQDKSPRSAPADARRLSINLAEAEVGVLADDAASWEQVQSLRLSGFRYRSLQSRMTVAERVKLLNRSNQDGLAVTPTGKRHFLETAKDFDPRAYGELARAYLRQGERKAAATVLEAREDRSRDAELRRAQAEELPGSGLATLGARGRWLAMWAFKLLFGYGHRPARVFVTLIPLWVLLTWFFGTVYDKGQFAPNSDVILTSGDWQDAVRAGCPLPADETFPAKLADGCTMPLALWTGDISRGLPPSDAAKDYETFGPWLYAADLFLPLDTIGQTEAWAPSKDRGAWGWWGYYLRFPVQVFGWIIVAMSAAILTGLVGRRED